MTISKEPFDETTKAFYQRLFKNWGFEVESEREIFSRSRTIDLVVTCQTDRTILQQTVFSHFQQLNAIELKGIHDPLTIADYNRILMRVYGLGVNFSTKTVPLLNQITLSIICVTRPNKILNQLKDIFRFEKKAEGIYHCDDVLEKWIICPNELSLEPKNYPLLALARGKKLEQFIQLCLDEVLNDYLQLIIDVGLATDPELIWRKILEIKQMKPIIHEETWSIIDQFFRETPGAIGKLKTFQEALAEMLSKGEQQGIQKGMQKGMQQGMQQGVRQGKQ